MAGDGYGYGEYVELYKYFLLKGNTEVLVEKPLPEPFCPPQILHGLAQIEPRPW
jgi:hypothetical protein